MKILNYFSGLVIVVFFNFALVWNRSGCWREHRWADALEEVSSQLRRAGRVCVIQCYYFPACSKNIWASEFIGIFRSWGCNSLHLLNHACMSSYYIQAFFPPNSPSQPLNWPSPSPECGLPFASCVIVGHEPTYYLGRISISLFPSLSLVETHSIDPPHHGQGACMGAPHEEKLLGLEVA